MVEWIAKTPTKVCAFAIWSESTHFAHVRRRFFAWHGPIIIVIVIYNLMIILICKVFFIYITIRSSRSNTKVISKNSCVRSSVQVSAPCLSVLYAETLSTLNFLKQTLRSVHLGTVIVAQTVIVLNQEENGKQCSSLWDGSPWPISSGSTLFVKVSILVYRAERAKQRLSKAEKWLVQDYDIPIKNKTLPQSPRRTKF